MDIVAVFGSTNAFVRIILIFVNIPICLTICWQLIPRLAPDAKRLAIGFLVAQIIVIVVPLEIEPSSQFEKWLWHIDLEWNIPSMYSSTQLALIGGVALLTAFLNRGKYLWQSLYLVVVALFMLFLSLEEFFSWKSYVAGVQTGYVRLGALVAIGTMIVAAISPRRERLWLICLLTGLTLTAIGSLVIDLNPRPCDSFGFLRFRGCMRVYIFEESIEYLGSWLALVAVLGLFSSAEANPKRHIRFALYALPALWIAFIAYYSPSHDIEVNAPDLPASVEFDSGAYLYGYHKDTGGIPASVIFRLPDSAIASELGYSIHLVDQVSGDSIVSLNDYVDRKHIVWPKRFGFVPLYRQSVDIEIAPGTPVNRALWTVLTHWRQEGREFVHQAVISSDLQLMNKTQVVLGELVLPAVSDNSVATPVAVFDNGFTLDSVDLPVRGRPGEIMTIPFTWRSEVAGDEDHVQFLHLGHAESGEWWIYDQHPLGRRLPTRLWYSGLEDIETWQVPIPADLAPGSYNIFTGLYRARDNVRVPVSDAEGRPWVDARVSLGILTLD